jgi:hypothetical protein
MAGNDIGSLNCASKSPALSSTPADNGAISDVEEYFIGSLEVTYVDIIPNVGMVNVAFSVGIRAALDFESRYTWVIGLSASTESFLSRHRIFVL